MITTYTALISAISAWLVRDDPDTVNRIPEFIQLAEADLRALAETRKVVSGALQLTGATVTLPDDVGTLLGVTITSGVASPLSLRVQTWDQVMALRMAAGATTTGTPTVYCVEDDDLILAVPPDQLYDSTIRYIERLDLATDGTNWLLTEQPNAYLYGALLHAAPFLSDDSRVAMWDGLYQKALRALRVGKDRAEFSGPLVAKVATQLGS